MQSSPKAKLTCLPKMLIVSDRYCFNKTNPLCYPT